MIPHKSVLESDQKSKLSNYIKDPNMISILNKKGIVRLLPIQYSTFDLIYKGEDVVAKDRTGSGKTLAFTLPIIMRMRQMKMFQGFPTVKFLVVLPTRELAIQVKDQMNSVRLKNQDDFVAAAIYGGAGIQDQLHLLSKGADIIVGTPGRLIDFIERKAIKLQNLQVLCLDEADEMLNIGFKQDIQRIFKHITWAKKQKVQCLMFSATIPQWIWKMSNIYQSKTRKFIDMIQDGNVKTSKTVEHCCLYAEQCDKQYAIGPLIHYFLNQKRGRILVFCDTKKDVDRIGSSRLIPTSVGTLHGDYSQFQRQRVFHDFKNGKLECLVATNVAARGLDFPEIDLIIQLSPPSTTDAYIHRSGRTGRAGKQGICVTLYDYKQQNLMQRIQNEAKLIFSHINPKQIWQYNIDYNRSENREQQNWNNFQEEAMKNSNNNNNNNRYGKYDEEPKRRNYEEPKIRSYQEPYQNRNRKYDEGQDEQNVRSRHQNGYNRYGGSRNGNGNGYSTSESRGNYKNTRYGSKY